MLRHGQTAETVAQMSRQMQDVNHLLVLQGSTAVIKAHAAMQSLNVQEARTKFAAALLAIRKDMGLESRSLEAKELVQLLLSESDKMHGSARSIWLQDSQ